MAINISVVKYASHLLLCVLELFITIWYPLCQTLHYYLINQKSKEELSKVIYANLVKQKEQQAQNANTTFASEANGSLNLGLQTSLNGHSGHNHLKKDATDKAIDLKQKATQALRQWILYWCLRGIVIYITVEVLWFFPFAYEIRVITGVLQAHPNLRGRLLKFLKKQLLDNPYLYMRAEEKFQLYRDKLEDIVREI